MTERTRTRASDASRPLRAVRTLAPSVVPWRSGSRIASLTSNVPAIRKSRSQLLQRMAPARARAITPTWGGPMTKRAWTRASDISARLVAMSSVALALFVFSVDAEALLFNFISISTYCQPNVNQGASGQTGPVVNSNTHSASCTDFFGPSSGQADASSSVDFGVMKIYAEGTASGFTGYASANVTLDSTDMVTVNPLNGALI